MRSKIFWLVLGLYTVSRPALADTYEVGPGKQFESIGEAPWESLKAGDVVLIHWREDPYHEKWTIGGQGTANEPITVRGVPNASGALPVISGENAITPTKLDYWNEQRGVIQVGGSSIPAGTPSYIVIEHLDVMGGKALNQFTDDEGQVREYGESDAASIHLSTGDQITVRGCILHDSNNGIQSTPEVSNVLVESCYIHGNGKVGSHFEHNAYTIAAGITYQLNYFGALREGAEGSNLKDRSAGCVVRYNWITGGNRQLSLVESATLSSLPSYQRTFVYGNVIIEGAGLDDWDNDQILSFGADSPSGESPRPQLFFYSNTVISRRATATTLFYLPTNEQQVDCRNNIFATEEGSHLYLLNSLGQLALSNNYVQSGWQEYANPASGAGITGQETFIEAPQPGFNDPQQQDYTLEDSSPCVGQAAPLAAECLPDNDVTFYYVSPQTGAERTNVEDLGAFPLGAQGTAGGGAGGSGHGGATGSSGDGAAPAGETMDEAAEDSGCGCKLTEERPPTGRSWWLLLGAALALLGRGRRGRSSTERLLSERFRPLRRAAAEPAREAGRRRWLRSAFLLLARGPDATEHGAEAARCRGSRHRRLESAGSA